VVVAVTSINWSDTAMKKNREVGAIIHYAPAAEYYLSVFNYDWGLGTDVSPTPASISIPSFKPPTFPAEIAHAPITGIINITCFTNPDNGYAYDLVMAQIASAQEVFHAEMYSNELSEIATQLVATKQANPNMDMTVIFSNKRAGSDDTPTQEATESKGGVNIFQSSTKFTYQHAKFWMIDNYLTIVSSGNWDGTSLTAVDGNSSPNREWLVAINSPCVLAAYQSVFNADRGIATHSTLSCPLSSYDSCGVYGGNGKSCLPASNFEFDACSECGGSATSASQCEVSAPGSSDDSVDITADDSGSGSNSAVWEGVGISGGIVLLLAVAIYSVRRHQARQQQKAAAGNADDYQLLTTH